MIPADIADACYHVCRTFQVDDSKAPPWQNVALLIGTGSVETDFMRVNYGREAAGGIGIFSMDPNEVMRIFLHELRYKKFSFNKLRSEPWKLFCNAWLGIRSLDYFTPSMREIRHLLVDDLRFAAATAYWSYLGSLKWLGDSLPVIANHWHTYYLWPGNHNQRESVEFLDAWERNACPGLMHMLHYN